MLEFCFIYMSVLCVIKNKINRIYALVTEFVKSSVVYALACYLFLTHTIHEGLGWGMHSFGELVKFLVSISPNLQKHKISKMTFEKEDVFVNYFINYTEKDETILQVIVFLILLIILTIYMKIWDGRFYFYHNIKHKCKISEHSFFSYQMITYLIFFCPLVGIILSQEIDNGTDRYKYFIKISEYIIIFTHLFLSKYYIYFQKRRC